jgi:MtrB/PioB family decaheme-associated outer membrane protein
MNRLGTFKLSGIAIALVAAFGPARAVEPIMTQNVEPAAPAALNTGASTASVGIGYANDDGRRFGQYNGMNEKGAYGLIDFNWVKRNDESGTWTRFFGRDVGLDDRQLRFEQQRQGNWGYSIDYSRIPRFEPFIANTAVGGIGTSNLVIPTTLTPGGPTELKTKREAIGLGLEKYFAGNWDVQVKFRNEQKDGTRIFARGTTGTGPAGSFGQFEFAPEPIDATTRQLEAKVNYNGGALLLTGGYYGTMYNNNFDSGLNFTGGLAGLSTFTPIGLPPDNQSHQLYVSGNYTFTPTTRSNFKLAYGKITQDAQFIVPPTAGLPNQLDGRIETKLAQFGVTSRPIPKLTLYGDVRVEDRDDKTPVRDYFTLTQASTSNGDNEPRSIKTTGAKAEANYALPDGFRIIGGVGWEEKKRNISAIRVVSARETTDETTWRVELRRPMAETLVGSVALMHSDRGGSPFQTTVQTSGAVGSNLIAPVFLADRVRDKVRVSANWAPANALNIQFYADKARDEYSGRDGSNLGPRTGEATNWSLDASYTFNDRWQANAWYSRNDTHFDQSTCEAATSAGVCPASATDPIWGATMRNLSNNVGAGLHAKPTAQIDLGAELTYAEITDQNHLQTIAGGPILGSLPDSHTKTTRLNLFARYALQKNSGVRLDYIYDRFKTDDWTWASWTFADGTTLTENPTQRVNFLGVSYYYKFQ